MKARTCLEIPINLSGFWKPVYTKSPISTGSLGAGLVLRPGVVCCESERPLPVLPHHTYFERKASCLFRFPLGKGFSSSAVYSLAHSFLNSNNFSEAVSRAHVVEVLMRTGLGDVMAISQGHGIAIRVKPGGPGWGKVISIRERPRPVLVSVLPKSRWIDTPSMLSSVSNYRKFDDLWSSFLEDPSLEAFLEAAKDFSKFLGTFPKELDGVNEVEGVIGSYAKKSVFVVVLEDWSVYGEAEETLKKVLGNVYVFEISQSKIEVPLPLAQ